MTSTSKSLYISYQFVLVGTLIINEHQQYQFQYDKDWLNSTKAFALSCSLPLQLAPFSPRYSYAFFSNLIPEGNLRQKIANELGISEDNDFALLDAIGGDVAGAISLWHKPPTPNNAGDERQRDVSKAQLADIILSLEKKPFLVAEEGVRLSLAGAQNKLPIIYQNGQFSLPLGSTPSSHILKPDPNRVDVPYLAINEAFCMMLAKRCGLQVAEVELFELAGQHCFITQRYDRNQQQRLHQEDFCQALGILPSHKYEVEGGPAFADCSALISQFSSRPAADKKRLLQWTLFNYLIGNADAHGKNISFLYLPHCVLSPFYDLLSTAAYPELNVRLSMKIGAENRPEWVMPRHWQQYCDDVNIPYKMLQRESQLLIKKLTLQAELLAIEEPYCDHADFVKKIIDVIQQRSQWLDSRVIK
jgi:serine/threonine-protein kinase HipA